MKTILTPEQSRAARRALGLTQNQLIEKSQLSGYKLKQFESGFADPEGVVPFLRELRDFFETQGYEFADVPERTEEPQPGDHVRVVRDAVVMCDRLTHSQRGAIQERVRELTTGLHDGLRKKAGQGVFDPYDDETDLARDRTIAVLAEVGVLYMALFDNCPFGVPPKALQEEPRKAKTISDVVALRFVDALRLTEHTSRSDERDGQGTTTPPAAQPRMGVLERRRADEARQKDMENEQSEG